MSILIKGMEMPKNCGECLTNYMLNVVCDCDLNNIEDGMRLPNCPIIEVSIVHCCECKYNNHCLTQSFVEEGSRIPFDRNTYFCSDGVKEE